MTETAPQKGFKKRFLEYLAEHETALARKWVSAAHRRLFGAQWGIDPVPEWFDHSLDLYYQWSEKRSSFWVERGVFGSLALRGERVLELACGDGFNTKYFYSLRSKDVVACDFDPTAIAVARRKNEAPNVRYVEADIRYSMPDGRFENVVWDAAIEHFTPNEIEAVMQSIKRRLTPDGILSGYTIVEKLELGKQLCHHEYEFKDMEDLKRFFTPHFKEVKVFETLFPDRHNLYFWASDGAVPFGDGWAHMV